MKLPKLHTWEWLMSRSLSRDVDILKSKGFDGWHIMDHFYSHEKSMTKDSRKIIAFNRGSNVRIIGYSKRLGELLTNNAI